MSFSMPGDELGLCPCGHRNAMCHRVNAAKWCGGEGDPYVGPLVYVIKCILEHSRITFDGFVEIQMPLELYDEVNVLVGNYRKDES